MATDPVSAMRDKAIKRLRSAIAQPYTVTGSGVNCALVLVPDLDLLIGIFEATPSTQDGSRGKAG